MAPRPDVLLDVLSVEDVATLEQNWDLHELKADGASPFLHKLLPHGLGYLLFSPLEGRTGAKHEFCDVDNGRDQVLN